MNLQSFKSRFPARTWRRAAGTVLGLALAVARALPADSDGDGLEDALENDLMIRFAPVVRLHPNDEYRPTSVTGYLASTSMRFNHGGCSDCPILGLRSVNVNSLITKSHPEKELDCDHTDNYQYSWSPTPHPFYTTAFFLEIPHNGDKETTRRGELASAVCYAHVRRSPAHHPMMFDIQYWFFYAYNGSIPFPGHEGDWEHITVRVESNGQTIHRIFYDAHNNSGKWYPAANSLPWPFDVGYYLTSGRPIVYSAIDSHASYPSVGRWENGLDTTADGGPTWDCAQAVVNLGEGNAPTPGSEWIQYTGRWGEVGPGSSGPEGPAFKEKWQADPMGDDDPDPFDHPSWVFVDQSNPLPESWPDAGSYFNPFKKFRDGVEAVPSNGTVFIYPGSYSAVGTYTKRMTLEAPRGGVMLGD